MNNEERIILRLCKKCDGTGRKQNLIVTPTPSTIEPCPDCDSTGIADFTKYTHQEKASIAAIALHTLASCIKQQGSIVLNIRTVPANRAPTSKKHSGHDHLPDP